MLRQNFTKIVTSPKVYKKVLILSYLVAFVTWFTVPFLPLMGESGFISENAINANRPVTAFNAQLAFKVYRELQTFPMEEGTTAIPFIENFFTRNNMPYQRLNFSAKSTSTKNEEGTNVYGIYRSKRGDTGECNMIAFSHDFSNDKKGETLGISLALSFAQMFNDLQNINYNSRDIIFLAYDGRFRTYGKAIEEFLTSYHSEKTPKILRCGVIRQALNIEIDKENFNRVALLHQGINSRVSDLDFYVVISKLLESNLSGVWDLNVNTTTEKKINSLLYDKYYSYVISLMKNVLSKNIPFFEATTTLNSLKEYLLGRPHDVHTYLLEKGILAVTLKGFYCETCKSTKTQEALIEGLGKVIEATNRGLMALQEQLHAGSTFWISLSKKNVYFGFGIIPTIVCIIVCFCLKGIVSLYEQSGTRNLFLAGLDHFTILVNCFAIYKLPNILKFVYGKILNKETSICPNHHSKYIITSDFFFIVELTLVLFLCLSGTALIRKLLRKALGSGTQKYVATNWKTKYALICCYLTIVIIGCALSNFVTAIIGVFLVIPPIILVSPIRKMSVLQTIGNLLAFIWMGITSIIVYEVFRHGNQNIMVFWIDLLKNQSCNGSDLYKFIVFLIFPYLVYIYEIWTYKKNLSE